MLIYRLITSVILLPLIILINFQNSHFIFNITILIINLLIVFEWIKISNTCLKNKITGYFVFVLIKIIFIYLIYLNKYLNIIEFIIYIAFILWMFIIICLIYYPKFNFLFLNFYFFYFIYGYLTILAFFISIIFIKNYNNVYHIFNVKSNALIIFYILIIVWSFDSGSYIFGILFGNKKIVPTLSPGKTLEGLIGGIFTSIIVNLIYNIYFNIFFNILISVIFFVIILLGAFLGDLSESMFKRIFLIKNSSNLIPGHGGILDRTDSLISVFPFFVFVLIILEKFY